MSRTSGIKFSALLAGATAIYWVIYLLTPAQIDDLMFINYYKNINNGLADFSISSCIEYIKYVRLEENGRIPNFVCPFWLIHIPAALGSLLLAIFTTAMIYLIAVASFKRPISIVQFIVVWCAVAVLLPWRGGMFITDLTLNYVPVLAFNILFYLMLLKRATYPQHYLLYSLLFPLFALFCGMMHEGMSVPMCMAIAAYIAVNRFKITGTVWAGSVAYGLGTIIVLSAPGTFSRLMANDATTHVVTLKLIVKTIPATILMIFLCLSASFRYDSRKKLADLFHNSNFYMPFIISMAVVAVCARTAFQHNRAAWFGEGFAIIAMLQLLANNALKIKRSTINIATVSMIVILLLFFSGVIYWQAKYYRQDKEISQLLFQSQSGTVYYDIMRNAPLYTLKYPMDYTWINPVQAVILNSIDQEKTIAVVPTILNNFDNRKLTKIAGSAEVFNYDCVLLQQNRDIGYLDNAGKPVPGVAVSVEFLNYTDNSGKIFDNIPTLCQRFITSTGEPWIYLTPLTAKIGNSFIKIDFN